MVLQASLKVGLCNNCLMLNVNDGRLPRVRRINTYNQHIQGHSQKSEMYIFRVVKEKNRKIANSRFSSSIGQCIVVFLEKILHEKTPLGQRNSQTNSRPTYPAAGFVFLRSFSSK